MKIKDLKFRFIIPLWDKPPRPETQDCMFGYKVTSRHPEIQSSLIMNEAMILERVSGAYPDKMDEVDFGEVKCDPCLDKYPVSQQEKNMAGLLFREFGGGTKEDFVERTEAEFYEYYFSRPAVTEDTTRPGIMTDLPW